MASAMAMLTLYSASNSRIRVKWAIESHPLIVSREDESSSSSGSTLKSLPITCSTLMALRSSRQSNPCRPFDLGAGEIEFPELLFVYVLHVSKSVIGIECFHRLIFLGGNEFSDQRFDAGPARVLVDLVQEGSFHR